MRVRLVEYDQSTMEDHYAPPPRKLTVGSTFSGVGGADLGLERAGFDVSWLCEADAWKRSVLAAHWPGVPIYDDVRDVGHGIGSAYLDERGGGRERGRDGEGNSCSRVDLLVGGFPCQDLSVAGKRKGFGGERSVLAFEFLRIAESLRPRWLLMENVPGLLSSNGGRDLARLLDEVGACGYGWAYRILDARYFGVPQRRRRVFICARRTDSLVDSSDAAGLALRALWEGGSGDPTPRWPAREIASACARGRASVGSGVGVSADGVAGSLTKRYGKGVNTTCDDGAMIVTREEQPVSFYPTGGSQNFSREDGVSMTLKRGSGIGAESGTAIAFRKSKRAQTDKDDETWVDDELANTLNAFDAGDTRTTHAVAQTFSVYPEGGNGADLAASSVDRSPALTKVKSERGVHIAERMSVRRLTPIECERLMGWPDDWTAPPGVKAPDSKRYAACGDGIVSWVAYWIGMRIQMIEGLVDTD